MIWVKCSGQVKVVSSNGIYLTTAQRDVVMNTGKEEPLMLLDKTDQVRFAG